MSNTKKITPQELTATNKSIYEEESFNMKNFVIGTIVGGIVGAVAATLYAPKSGADLRVDLASQAGVLKDKGLELSSVAKEKTVQLSSQLKDHSVDLLEKVKQTSSTDEAISGNVEQESKQQGIKQ